MNMGRSLLWLALVAPTIFVQASSTTSGECLDASGMESPPMVNGATFIPGIKKSKDIFGCCQQNEDSSKDEDMLQLEPSKIGSMPQFTTDDTMKVLEKAKKAWNYGNGIWPQMSLTERIQHIETFLNNLKKERTAIIQLLMWEIGKNFLDAAAEFDRTIEFAQKVCYTVYCKTNILFFILKIKCLVYRKVFVSYLIFPTCFWFILL